MEPPPLSRSPPGQRETDECSALPPHNPALDQHFLHSLDKIRVLVEAAAIAPSHAVCELGAGIGSVARHLPSCAGLALVELDPRLCAILRTELRSAVVLEADALATLRAGAFDVVVSSLPFFLTEGILGILAGKARSEAGAGGPFQRAVMSVHAEEAIADCHTEALCISELCVLRGADFSPAQPFDSRLILVTPKKENRDKGTDEKKVIPHM